MSLVPLPVEAPWRTMVELFEAVADRSNRRNHHGGGVCTDSASGEPRSSIDVNPTGNGAEPAPWRSTVLRSGNLFP
jgi:hypothetical protein